MSELQAALNTDREIWRESENGPSIHVTEGGGIGINVGGHVIVLPVREWFGVVAKTRTFALPVPAPAEPAQEVESRSSLKRKAVMRGEKMPTFAAEPVSGETKGCRVDNGYIVHAGTCSLCIAAIPIELSARGREDDSSESERQRPSKPHNEGSNPSGRSNSAPSVAGETKKCDITKPCLSLLVKLGSIAVHAEEILEPGGHRFDLSALSTLLEDSEVREWLIEMSKSAFLPVKR